jgi:chemotaxis-related protein WspD
MVFGVGSETFALRTVHLSEVVRTRNIRRIPHRDASVLHGLVNIHGLLRPCVSLAAVLGVEPGSPAPDPGALVFGKRMLVARAAGGPLVMPVDVAHGTHRVLHADLRPPPATVAVDAARFTTAVFAWRDRAVAVLDGETLFGVLETKLP